jgi:hypothetical protein
VCKAQVFLGFEVRERNVVPLDLSARQRCVERERGDGMGGFEEEEEDPIISILCSMI